ncbi:transcription-repair coupling factor [Polymorphum gilvum]|uniref:Transcription-repair-coupling factor n=1 Tax=Polymorphum gilvum (strain LMG 25793 / CGMCC 1.9160 / SL003B-26A1) TaxID=991905 RepID=F2J0R2_POLGS|nr:transcription-repair coupling factor [Polymorphum gilvum]ADZ70748.1 Mfd, transcription-repair coupling factor [Polymorphum gilvum SL003B-26A1]
MFESLLQHRGNITLAGVPDGAEAYALAKVLAESDRAGLALVFVARDAARMQMIADALAFFSPATDVLQLPAWDCLPYDRVSPTPAVSARRLLVLGALARGLAQNSQTVLLTTCNAAVQRMPARDWMAHQTFSLAPGNRIDLSRIAAWLDLNGFSRTPTVRETGEYAVRGGIVDLYAPGSDEPVRLDFFGDTLESIRAFDPETQRTTRQLRRHDLVPMSEVVLTEEAVSRFRRAYLARFGAARRDDVLYQSISEGRRYPGMEHWLPLFHERLETLFDFIGDTPLIFDSAAADVARERFDQVDEHYAARKDALDNGHLAGAVPYLPVEPDGLYLGRDEWTAAVADAASSLLDPFTPPPGQGRQTIELGGRQGRTFAAERVAGDVNIFDALIRHVRALQKERKTVVIACWSDGSRDRLGQILGDHGLGQAVPVESQADIAGLDARTTGLAVLGLEHGFEIADLAFIAEQDILGDRLVRKGRRKAKGANVLTEATALSEGDLVVHVDHGIGRFVGLKTIEAVGAPHDCLELQYAGGDKLYLPVENIELLTRYGSEETEAQLDRLGGGAWQARKARMKKRILEIADGLIRTAAARALKTAPVVETPEGAYDEFATRFPYEETEDQLNAIDAVFADLASGRPMDRLVCGDVGFGKTEVALRAAFVAALSGRQVAVVVPTTLLARQHYKTFAERFHGLPVRVAQASRLVGAKDLAETRKGLVDGSVDIVIGTHALLGKGIGFRDLGLLIIDEEQHFGVKHKERLKELKADVHVLTLSATPIPRTLQLALTGVRELSLIATPPVDRLAVRTFVSPFDPIVVREALLREHYRGGQSFYVCPRVSDLAETAEFLAESVPEVKVAVAHGQMAPGQLDDVMNAFYEGKYDVLLSTTIVESGLDIPTANTLIVHRADMFGLAQLYQLRGRVGRSKVRAYALFTVPANKTLTATAERRLKVLQSLDTLGAGFQLASHDLDIRGAGNLLGEEQSGHIREVGFELYQQMLEEAVASLKDGGAEAGEEHWSPQINVGTPVLIPEAYVPDLQLRLSLYRRLADLAEAQEIDAFGAELIDRFGPLPEEVGHLLKIVFIKGLCRKANVEKVDTGPKGMVISFRNNEFANPAALVGYIAEQGVLAKIRPDQKVVFTRDWASADERLKGTATIMTKLARLAGADKAAA